MGALRDKDEDVRGYAALALGDIGDRRATDRLLERCDQDSNAQVRGFAAMALGKLKDPKSLEPMLLRLEEEKDAKALAASVFAVGELRAPKARPALERLTKHEDPDVSAYAKEAVKALGGKPVTE